MACGDALLATYGVTSDGKTVAKPWVGFPGPLDYEDWRVVAQNMWGLMHRDMIALGVEEEKRVAAGTLTWAASRWNALVGEAGNDGTLKARLDNFSTPIVESFSDFPSMSWDGSITAVINLCRDIACAWEQIDDAIATYDPTKVPRKPAAPAKSGASLFGFDLSTLLIVGVGAWLLLGGGGKALFGGDGDD